MQSENHNKKFARFLLGPILVLAGGCAQFDAFLNPDSKTSAQQTESATLAQERTEEQTASTPVELAVPGDAPFPAYAQGEDMSAGFVDTANLEADIRNEQSPNEESPSEQSQVAEAEATAQNDVWERIRNGFMLDDHEHKRIKREFNWYARHPEYIDRVVERARPYLYFIAEEVDARSIPAELALLPIVESAFQPFAYSHGRASGIWQFIPSTGRMYGLKQTWWYDGRRDVYMSTKAALRYLEKLSKQFDGDWLLALAAYNSGAGTVRKAIRYNKKRGKPTDFFSLRLPRETRGYVPKLLALKRLVANSEDHGITIASIANQPYFERVEVGSQIDLALVAELAEMDIDELYKLNPAFNRWATDPAGPHHVLLPVERVESFVDALEKLPADQRVRWVRHKIKSGEALSTIAAKYHTSVSSIKRMNRIRGTRIRAGKSLIIPVASRSATSYKHSEEQRKKRTVDQPRNGTKIIHLVQRGDTLWDIARTYGVGMRQLAKWNGMATRDPLKPGQKLVVWSTKSVKVSAVSMGNLQSPPERQVTKRIGYRVKRGDSLSRISSRFNVSVAQLRRWNRLPKGKYLQPGQHLTLYVDVTRQTSRS